MRCKSTSTIGKPCKLKRPFPIATLCLSRVSDAWTKHFPDLFRPNGLGLWSIVSLTSTEIFITVVGMILADGETICLPALTSNLALLQYVVKPRLSTVSIECVCCCALAAV